MKIIITCLLIWVSFYSVAQQKKTTTTRKGKKTVAVRQTQRLPGDTITYGPNKTITDKYLNGGRYPSKSSAASSKSSGDSSPFAGGIHAADNAKKTYDSITPVNPNSITYDPNNVKNSGGSATIVNNQSNTLAQSNTTGSLINDSAVNVHSIVENGLPTNSGAVDKSGQMQFGQTNWGENRRTIGESQWTIPPPVSSSFKKEYPSVQNITWSRSGADSSIYFARYQRGADWIISSYNPAGNRLDERREMSLQQLPKVINTYIGNQPAGFQATYINRLQIQGKPEVYEIVTKSGKTIYLNTNGAEVNY